MNMLCDIISGCMAAEHLLAQHLCFLRSHVTDKHVVLCVGLQAGWQVVLDQALVAGCSALLDCGALLAEADAG
jgi:hypothetical protein